LTAPGAARHTGQVDPDRVEFLFGRPDVAADLADEHARWELLRADRPGVGARMLAVRTVLATQILADDPPEVWWTARRLLAVGRDRHDVMDELARALLPLADRVVGDGRPLDRDEYAARLAALPRSAAAVAGEVYADLVRRHGVITVAELQERISAHLGLEPGDVDEIAAAWCAVSDPGPDVDERPVAPGLVVHAPTLAGAAVLTHRPTEEEHATCRLRVDTDLASFSACGARGCRTATCGSRGTPTAARGGAPPTTTIPRRRSCSGGWGRS